LKQPLSDGKDALRPRFIFGPIGNGYRLTRMEFWIVEALGITILVPGTALIVLAKMEMVTPVWGLGGFAASLVLAFTAIKIYVSAAGVPQVTRPFTEKFLANADHLPLLLIYALPILLGLLVALIGYELITTAMQREASWFEVLVLLGLATALVGSLSLGLWIKRKLAERSHGDLE
jgi:hypothetical protein